MSHKCQKKHRYRAGDYYVTCERSGFKTLYSNTRREWNGLLVRADLFEPRQPQDHVRGIKEDISVEEPRSGWLDDQFLTNRPTQEDL